MFHITIMSGYEGVIRAERKVYFTLFGGADFRRATVARQLLAWRQPREKEGGRTTPRQFFLTICGGVEIKVPTLAEEFLDLRQLIDSGSLSMSDWDRAMAELGTDVSISSFTLMGGMEEGTLPSESEEIEALALQRHLGNISEPASQVLQFGIGQRDAERRATVRRAALVEA
jgi:hypothetical protein